MSPQRIKPAPTKAGDFVLQNQELATKEGFGNVSKSWFDTTTPIEDERKRLIAMRDQSYSLSTKLGRIFPAEVGGSCVLQVRDRDLRLDSYAAGQFGQMVGVGSEYPKKMLESGQRGAAEMLAAAFEHGLKAVNHDKEVVLRIDRDEKRDVLRGLVSARTNWFCNVWLLGVLERVIPGGRLSHHRGDAYTLRANILIPDTIRKEADSEYGALVSVANCEVIKCGFRLRPALFRAICCNGCIWGATKGQAFKLDRRAAQELHDLEKQIKENIEAQIPLSLRALDQLLATRSFSTSVSIKPVLAQVARHYHLNKNQTSVVLNAWNIEARATPELGHTLFGVVNAVTRAGQDMDDRTWTRFDEMGGSLAQLSKDEWDNLVALASNLTAKQVDDRYATWSLAG